MHAILTQSAPVVQPKRSGASLLRRAYWIGIAILVVGVAVTARPQYLESALGAAGIAIASLLPVGLWVHGKAKGLPLYPVYALTHLWTFGLPLLYEHPIIILFPADNQLIAGLTVTGFLLCGTAVWYLIARRPVSPVQHAIMINSASADYLFLAALAGGIVFFVVSGAGWLNLTAGVTSLVRAIMIAVDSLSAFVLCYRAGQGDLSTGKTATAYTLTALLVIVNLNTLFLIGSMSICGIALFGYTIGARRFPWILTVMLLAGFGLLHSGKGEMRTRYWQDEEQGAMALSPLQYPGFLAEWLGTSWEHIGKSEEDEIDPGQSLLERASLMQLLLFVQHMTPDEVPYMNGSTYAIIPSLFVPRLLNPDKPASHEGTYMLNIHYGLQTAEQTQRTTIGFGLLNESFANFGYIGIAGLAIVLACYYGVVGRFAGNAPILSLRSLFAVIVASYSFQSEFAAGVYVAALFQSTVALLLMAVFFMRTQAVPAAAISVTA